MFIEHWLSFKFCTFFLCCSSSTALKPWTTAEDAPQFWLNRCGCSVSWRDTWSKYHRRWSFDSTSARGRNCRDNCLSKDEKKKYLLKLSTIAQLSTIPRRCSVTHVVNLVLVAFPVFKILIVSARQRREDSFLSRLRWISPITPTAWRMRFLNKLNSYMRKVICIGSSCSHAIETLYNCFACLYQSMHSLMFYKYEWLSWK